MKLVNIFKRIPTISQASGALICGSEFVIMLGYHYIKILPARGSSDRDTGAVNMYGPELRAMPRRAQKNVGAKWLQEEPSKEEEMAAAFSGQAWIGNSFFFDPKNAANSVSK
ncbi:uncharacterized protein LOC110010489 [Jatropha curcas]|uniref:uncharacterized protein LOC110010489 n=1 Tax=Jatropha curcas TaxID=180498 RepID=UPI0009D77ED6|nr:uncharacterized protein LOC110010489 [Jatropha curcas]XP_037497883.1 uncharacterized protein LOC110010489 [Jatropha curcas]